MDRKNLLFHIKSDDYFGTLATLIDLVNQEIERRGFRKSDAELIDRLKDDLVFLQKNYVIKKRKSRSPVSSRKPSRNR
jgi:hypothetical protein